MAESRAALRALALALLACCDAPGTQHQATDAGDPGHASDGGGSPRDGGTSDSGEGDAAIPTDAPPADAATDAAIDAPPPPPPRPASVTYPEGPLHSPIDAAIAARLQSIVAGNTREFAKVGDSITAREPFFNCFGGDSIDLGSHSDLADTLAYFRAGNAGGTSPFERYSLAAISGATTQTIVSGAPSPLSMEIAAIDPSYAVIMLGTNDIRVGRSYDAFGADLWAIVDQTIASGAIPIMSTIPPNNADSTADARIPTANRVIRAIAQGRRIPLVDYYREMLPLPSRGISSDGVHPTVASSGACILNSTGLQYGYNVRNLVSLEALDRARMAAAGTALDGTVGRPPGNGTADDPYVVDAPFTDLNDSRDREMRISSYPCNGRPQTGGEVVYRVDLSSPAVVDALVIDRGSTDVDVHIVQGSPTAQACIASGDHQATASVSAGSVFILVDSPASTSAGEYLLVVQTH